MDTHTLITIVVTAVITAVSRSVVSIIHDWLKRTAISAIESRQVRLGFSKPGIAFIVDGFICIGFMLHAFSKFSGVSLATMSDLRDLFAYSVMMSLIITLAIYDGIALRRFYDSQP